jgi:hypothetical protein
LRGNGVAMEASYKQYACAQPGNAFRLLTRGHDRHLPFICIDAETALPDLQRQARRR